MWTYSYLRKRSQRQLLTRRVLLPLLSCIALGLGGCVAPGAVQTEATVAPQLEQIVKNLETQVQVATVAARDIDAVVTGLQTGAIGGDGDSVVSWILAVGSSIGLTLSIYMGILRPRRKSVEAAEETVRLAREAALREKAAAVHNPVAVDLATAVTVKKEQGP